MNGVVIGVDDFRIVDLEVEGHQRLIPAEDVLEPPLFYDML
jgi:hypothetical protein